MQGSAGYLVVHLDYNISSGLFLSFETVLESDLTWTRSLTTVYWKLLLKDFPIHLLISNCKRVGALWSQARGVLEIRNWKWDMGHGKQEMGHGPWVIVDGILP